MYSPDAIQYILLVSLRKNPLLCNTIVVSGVENEIQYDANGDREGTYVLQQADLENNVLALFAKVASSGVSIYIDIFLADHYSG